MRIDKLLAANGIPRNEIKKAIKEGEILVQNQAVTSLAQNVDTGLQTVVYQGMKLTGANHRYYMLNKPIGVVSANTDPHYPTVFDCLASVQKTGLYTLGRLDRDTSGLLIITDNGPLGFSLLHPDRHVTKTYEVCLNGPLDQDAVRAFAAGIVFRGGEVAKPALLEIINSNKKESWARVCITEGKRHQIKKMFLAVGVKVMALKRVTFGDFLLDPNLKEGDFRELNEDEKQIVVQYLSHSRGTDKTS